jgi:hypothetical protein
LIEQQGGGRSFRQVTHLANEKYWSSFIDVRRHDLEDTKSRLGYFTHRDSCSDSVTDAIKSLEAAVVQYESDQINAERCAQFLEAWQRDISEWGRTFSRINSVRSVRDAMDWLEVPVWLPVR